MSEAPASFRRGKLGDALTLKRGYDLPEQERIPGDVPIVTSSGITGAHNEAKVAGPGVVTGRYGTLGEVYYVKEDFWPHNTALYVSDFKGNDPRFIGYFLKTLQLGSTNAAGAVPGVNRNVLHALDILIPPLPTQRRIAAILAVYDDLIENNRRRMALLEEAMHLLYREWFVHLRFPGYERTQIVDGVPEGWHKTAIDQVVQEMRRRVHPSDYESSVPYVGLEHIPRQSIALTEWGSSDDVTSDKFGFERGEILFGKIRPYFHKVVVAPVSGICSSDTIVLKPTNSSLFGLVLATVSSAAFVQYTSKTSKEGSKMPRADWVTECVNNNETLR